MPKQVLPEIRSALDEVFLILTVADFTQSPHQQSVAIVLNQAVPIRAPDALDHVPARAAENRFQFLNDLSVAAHRTVESLQVAVHHEDQVVELFARRQRDRSQRLRLVHLAVAEKCPNLAARRLLEAAILQILDEARMVNRLDRAQPHRDRRELPEFRHQPRMRIRTQSSAWLQLAPEILQLLLRNAAFEISARINSRRGVSLEVDDVTVASLGLRAEEMIECHFVERGRGGKGRNMSADAFLNLVRAYHHGQRIPADQALDAPFHLLAARKWRLLPDGNRVLIRRRRRKWQVDAAFAPRMQRQLLQQTASPVRAAMRKNIVQGIDPLPGFQHF